MIREVPLDTIDECDQLRLRHPPYPQVEELACQIKLQGLTTPLFVRGVKSRFELISGYRRLAALRLLGAETALVRIFELDDAQAYDLAISENQHRDALTELERADICLRLQGAGHTPAEIAERMGWTTDRSVRRYVQLAQDAPDPLREFLQQRAISFRSAMVFLAHALDLTEEHQRQILTQAAKNEMSSPELERLLLRIKAEKPANEAKADRIKPLRKGGFVLRTTRFEADDPTDVRQEKIQLLKAALRKARRLDQAISRKKTDRTPTGPMEVPS